LFEDVLRALSKWWTPARRFAATKVALFSAFVLLYIGAKLNFADGALRIMLSEPSTAALAIAAFTVITLAILDYFVYRDEMAANWHRRELSRELASEERITPEERRRAVRDATQ